MKIVVLSAMSDVNEEPMNTKGRIHFTALKQITVSFSVTILQNPIWQKHSAMINRGFFRGFRLLLLMCEMM